MVPLRRMDGAKVVQLPASGLRKGRLEVSLVGWREVARRVEMFTERKSTAFGLSPLGVKM
jgi:hypothetical protein